MDLTTEQKTKWLTKNIPHRVRVVAYGIPMKAPWAIPAIHFLPSQGLLARQAIGDAAWEGRYSAMRWLIGFIGISYDPKTDKPKRCEHDPKNKDTEVRITDIKGKYFPTEGEEAMTLAKMWKACTIATSHSTENTSKDFERDEAALARALNILVQHLESTIYKASATSLNAYVMNLVNC